MAQQGQPVSALNSIIANLSQRCCQCTSHQHNSTKDNKRALKLLANAFQSLSVEEQDRIQKNFYGQQGPIQKETSEFIDAKLKELETELNALSDHVKAAFTAAMEMEEREQEVASATSKKCSESSTENHNNKEDGEVAEEKGESKQYGNIERYVSSRKLRLMFLRAERYNARLAARRLARCFNEKLQLFGKDKLNRRIKQEDLDEDDLKALRSGGFVIPGINDKAGRLIILKRRCRHEGVKPLPMKRAAFYLLHSYLEDDEEAQKNGVVFISYNIGNAKQLSFAEQRNSNIPVIRMVIQYLPVRIEGVHCCYSNMREHITMNIVITTFPTDIRTRMLCHYGSPVECALNLLTYGIDVDALPISQDGEFRDDDILEYLEKLRQKENEE